MWHALGGILQAGQHNQWRKKEIKTDSWWSHKARLEKAWWVSETVSNCRIVENRSV